MVEVGGGEAAGVTVVTLRAMSGQAHVVGSLHGASGGAGVGAEGGNDIRGLLRWHACHWSLLGVPDTDSGTPMQNSRLGL